MAPLPQTAVSSEEGHGITPFHIAAIVAGSLSACLLFAASAAFVRFLSRRSRETRMQGAISVGVRVDVFTVRSEIPVNDFEMVSPSTSDTLHATDSKPHMTQRSDSDMSLASIVESPCYMRPLRQSITRQATPSRYTDTILSPSSSLPLDSSLSLVEAFSTMDVDGLTRSTVRFPRMSSSQDGLEEYYSIASLHSNSLRNHTCDDNLGGPLDKSATSQDFPGMTLRLDVISPLSDDDSFDDVENSTLTFPTIPSLRSSRPSSKRAFAESPGDQSHVFADTSQGIVSLVDRSMDELCVRQDLSGSSNGDNSLETLVDSEGLSERSNSVDDTLVHYVEYYASRLNSPLPSLNSPTSSSSGRSMKNDSNGPRFDLSPGIIDGNLLVPAFSPILKTSLSPLKLELSPSSRMEAASPPTFLIGSEDDMASFDAVSPLHLGQKDCSPTNPANLLGCPTPHILDLTFPSTPLMDEILPMGELDLLSARMSVITVNSFANSRDPDRVGRVLQPLFESLAVNPSGTKLHDTPQMLPGLRQSVSSLKSAFTLSEPFSSATPPLLPFISLSSNPCTPIGRATPVDKTPSSPNSPDAHTGNSPHWSPDRRNRSSALSCSQSFSSNSPMPSRPHAPTPGSFLSRCSMAASPPGFNLLRVPSGFSPPSSRSVSPFQRPQAPTPGSIS